MLQNTSKGTKMEYRRCRCHKCGGLTDIETPCGCDDEIVMKGGIGTASRVEESYDSAKLKQWIKFWSDTRWKDPCTTNSPILEKRLECISLEECRHYIMINDDTAMICILHEGKSCTGLPCKDFIKIGED